MEGTQSHSKHLFRTISCVPPSPRRPWPRLGACRAAYCGKGCALLATKSMGMKRRELVEELRWPARYLRKAWLPGFLAFFLVHDPNVRSG